MAGEEDKIFSKKVNYNGVFQFRNFYDFLRGIMDDLGYWVVEGKNHQEMKGNSYNLEIEWSCKKQVSDYVKFNISLELVSEYKKINTEQGVDEGKLNFKISGKMIYDYQGKFGKTAYMKFMREVYDKFAIESRISKHKQKFLDESEEIVKQVKNYLAMEVK